MGPRFCKRGNPPRARGDAPRCELQWGHAFVSVETYRAVTVTDRWPRLQWGHAFVSVETLLTPVAAIEAIEASMGPRFCKRGNAAKWAKELSELYELQWGHAFVSVETYRPV